LAHNRLQEAIHNWGQLPIATGRALKLIKCSYYLISFHWNTDRTWAYKDNTKDEELIVEVPMANGSMA
jgi:hypothetical protein